MRVYVLKSRQGHDLKRILHNIIKCKIFTYKITTILLIKFIDSKDSLKRVHINSPTKTKSSTCETYGKSKMNALTPTV